MSTIQKLPTGVPGLDIISYGGIPKGRATLIAGRSGAGMTNPNATPAPRTAVVTGGTRGIGLGIARALAGEGWQIVVSGVRPAADVAGVLDELAGLGGTAHYCASDIAVAADRSRLVAESRERFGGIDALVNNAGRAPAVRADILVAGEESFETLIHTNLRAPTS